MGTLTRRELLIGLGSATALAACGGAATAPSAPGSASLAPLKASLGSVSVSAANSAIWAAEDGGYLKKYGLDATVTNIGDSTQAVAAMLKGDVPLNCGISGSAVVASNIQGSDLVILASTVNTFPSSLYAKTSFSSLAQLKGAKIGISRLGTASHTGGVVALKGSGVDAKDVTFVQLGGLNEILGALQSGQIDAGVLSPPQTVLARGFGFKELVDMGALGVPYVYNGVAASRAFIASNTDLVERTLKALIEGEHRFRTDAEFGKAVVKARTKLDDAAQIEETWRLFATKYLNEPPFPTEAAIKTVLDELATAQPKAAGASPASFYDDSFLKKLDQSGFIKSVTK